MYVYESHLGGVYLSDEIIPFDALYCETCGDSDQLLGEVKDSDYNASRSLLNMKITRKITATTEEMSTVFYKVEEDQMINAFKNSTNTNVFLIYMVESHGFECLDLSRMFGSVIADDGNLYICKTDGKPINVNGKEVDPEDALKECTIEELSAYIQDADDETILWYITPNEIIVDKDIDNIAKEMLEAGYHFDELVADCREIWPDTFY